MFNNVVRQWIIAAAAMPILLACLTVSAGAQSDRNVFPPRPLDEQRQEAIARRINEMFEEKVRSRQATAAPASGPQSVSSSAAAPGESAVSDDPAAEGEIHAAVNPNDSSNIVVSAIRSGTGGFTLPIHYTRDFGATWNTSSFAPGASTGGDPVLAFDADGVLYFSWLHVNFGQTRIDGAILFASSTDGGATWGAIDTVISSAIVRTPDPISGAPFTGEVSDKQWMAVDRSDSPYRNSLYAIFLLSGSRGLGIVVRTKRADSAAFTHRSVPVSGADFLDVQFAGIGVDADGHVHAFFWGTKGSGYALWHSVSTDGGENFAPATLISNVRFPSVRDSQGRPTVPAYLPQRLQALPQFAVDHHPQSPFRGNLYAVWCSNDPNVNTAGSFDEPLHIYFTHSSDAGASWSPPIRVNQDSQSFRADHFHPSIDVAPGGEVIVTWYDGRSAINNTAVDHYTAFSFDGGTTFAQDIRVSSQPSNINSAVQGRFGIGDYTKVVSTRGYAIPLWADGRANNGNLNIYAAFVPLSPNGSSAVERITLVGGEARFLDIAPQPAVGDIDIRFHLGAPSTVAIELVDVLGKRVRTIPERHYEPGDHIVAIDISDLSIGHYLCRLITPRSSSTRSVIVSR